MTDGAEGGNVSDRLLVATRKGLFELKRSATGWRVASRHFLGDNCSMVLADHRDDTWYAALDHGHFGAKLHRSSDHGGSWIEVAAPVYPPQPEGAPQPTGDMATPVPWTLKLVWELQAGGADQPGRIWCGTLPGGLFRSDDRGESWTLNRALWDMPERLEWFGGGADWPGIHSVVLDPRDARRFHVGVSCGGAWYTEDDGATWANRAHGMRAEYMPPERAGDPNIQDPHLVVRCPGAPECLWAQHHNGIFRTVDHGRSWTEVTCENPSSFGFAVAVHPEDPETAWFIPAIKDEKRIPADGRMVVTRTRDGGRSFELLTRGLPQEEAWDIVFRHALAIDGSGRRLAFGSTTGGVWITEDGGDSWGQVPARLPPVYAVRWTS